MNMQFPPRLLVLSPLLLFLLVSGCMQPDRLEIFATENLYQEPAGQAEVVEPVEMVQRIPDEIRIGTLTGEHLDLTVEQAIGFAMANNRDLWVERINPELASALEAVERGVYDPELFGELDFLHAERRDTEVDSTTTVEEQVRTGQVGLRQVLPTGTMLELSVGQERRDVSHETQEQSSRVGLAITQSLLRGFGPTVNLVSLRQAELDTAVSTSELRGITEAILAETETSYWDYVLAGQKITIFERSLAVALQQLDEIEQGIEVGTLPRIEAAAAKAEVARREQDLIDAHSTLEERRLRLLRLITPGSRGQFDLQIRPVSSAEINPAPLVDLDDRLLLAEKSRPDLNEARLRLKQNRLQTIMTRNGLLPRLDLFINLGKTGYADSFSGSFKDLDGNNHDLSGGIRLSHYLNNRQAEGRDLAARASRRQAMAAVENLQQLVELDVRLAMNEFARTRQQISASRVTHLLQAETLKAEKERFDVGDSTGLLLAQAQRDLLLSAIVEAESVVNCRKALVALYLAEGSLLERRGIRITGSPTRYP